ncbi:hypothetical protein LIER_01507 [Lithospermum erythrorhizon]|uniref:Uncharacterized protein n=1 Tax=Lithospermum erythrorhizon TaxID=34254 RepID=A0AAV3NMC6_LITER
MHHSCILESSVITACTSHIGQSFDALPVKKSRPGQGSIRRNMSKEGQDIWYNQSTLWQDIDLAVVNTKKGVAEFRKSQRGNKK